MTLFGKCTPFIAAPLAAMLLMFSMPLGEAQAGLISTEQVIDRGDAERDRARVMEFFARESVRHQFEALGVDPDEAAARVAGLSDEEIGKLAGRIDQLPAGQNGIGAIVGAALIVFLVLLVTDLLGLTEIFPFVKRDQPAAGNTG
jgi:hypothetical protein